MDPHVERIVDFAMGELGRAPVEGESFSDAAARNRAVVGKALLEAAAHTIDHPEITPCLHGLLYAAGTQPELHRELLDTYSDLAMRLVVHAEHHLDMMDRAEGRPAAPAAPRAKRGELAVIHGGRP